MFRRNRTPKPVPAPVDPAALTLGLRILADDRAAGDDWALEFFNDAPFDDDIANYPTSWVRKLRIFHLGKPGPGNIPWEAIELPKGFEIPGEFLRPRDELLVAEVRRLCELTIAGSVRVHAVEQARDTLTVLNTVAKLPGLALASD